MGELGYLVFIESFQVLRTLEYKLDRVLFYSVFATDSHSHRRWALLLYDGRGVALTATLGSHITWADIVLLRSWQVESFLGSLHYLLSHIDIMASGAKKQCWGSKNNGPIFLGVRVGREGLRRKILFFKFMAEYRPWTNWKPTWSEFLALYCCFICHCL